MTGLLCLLAGAALTAAVLAISACMFSSSISRREEEES